MKNKLFYLLLLSFFILSSTFVFGAAVELPNPLSLGQDFETILKTIGDWLIKLGGPIAGLMIIIGGFQIMISNGQPEKIKKGRTTILWTIIGYAILVIGWGITTIIESLIK